MLIARGVVMLLALLAVGCRRSPPASESGPTAAADSIAALAAADGRVLRVHVDGRQVALMVHECEVFDLAETARGNGRRTPLIRPDPYPWPTVCARQSMSVEEGWIIVTLGRMAVGAGGCCATGGTWRTRDGRGWERRSASATWDAVVPDSVG